MENLRYRDYQKLEESKKAYSDIKQRKMTNEENARVGQEENVKKIISLFGEELALKEKLKNEEMLDELYGQLSNFLVQQKDIFQSIGNDMLTADVEDSLWKSFLRLIELNENQWNIENGKLSENIGQHEAEVKKLIQQMELALNAKILIY